MDLSWPSVKLPTPSANKGGFALEHFDTILLTTYVFMKQLKHFFVPFRSPFLSDGYKINQPIPAMRRPSMLLTLVVLDEEEEKSVILTP